MQVTRYQALAKESYHFEGYSIVALRERDIYLIKDWRNSQLTVLRQKTPLTNTDQENYYRRAVLPTFTQEQPKIILFSFLQNETCIGYGGLTNIDWESRRIELSFLVDPAIYQDQKRYHLSFSAFITLIKQVTFEDLKFNRIFTETYDIRPYHIAILEQNGFRFEGRMRQHVVIDQQLVDSLLHGFLKEYHV
ncbi:ribosomal-protein-serine acetyltransferase [Adhaeribacter arboris]|uniref:Ribosomal-protein-serine acetyltransferase n=1 Tax=Adhaeribacter arboris TaxID=2072846 RepID=A0A2T2YAB6_9BACT|nr:GNAT family N-acetyltransferase [Adhaeribacter arboris]PSR52455.1 ribosomal-protein-serine acetyltransferase [Adhaeribacter arboris]